MEYDLVCVNPFGDYTTGQKVSDKGEVDRLMAEGREQNFVRVAKPEQPKEEPKEQKANAPRVNKG